MIILRCLCRLRHKLKPLYPPLLGSAADAGINAGGLHTGMTQNIRKMAQVFLGLIIKAGEQMPQVMGKDFSFVYTRQST